MARFVATNQRGWSLDFAKVVPRYGGRYQAEHGIVRTTGLLYAPAADIDRKRAVAILSYSAVHPRIEL